MGRSKTRTKLPGDGSANQHDSLSFAWDDQLSLANPWGLPEQSKTVMASELHLAGDWTARFHLGFALKYCISHDPIVCKTQIAFELSRRKEAASNDWYDHSMQWSCECFSRPVCTLCCQYFPDYPAAWRQQPATAIAWHNPLLKLRITVRNHIFDLRAMEERTELVHASITLHLLFLHVPKLRHFTTWQHGSHHLLHCQPQLQPQNHAAGVLGHILHCRVLLSTFRVLQLNQENCPWRRTDFHRDKEVSQHGLRRRVDSLSA